MAEEKKNEKISPYDWETFGFKIYDSDPQSFFITSKSPIMQEVLKLIDANTDGDLDVEEFERVRDDQYVNAHLSKMICCHRSEWSYRGDSLVKLKNDASAIYDEIIDKASPETQEQKQKYLQLKDESIKRFEQKAKNLSFMCEFPEFKTQQLPEFCFYYFHPFAFVEQMKRMKSEEVSKYLTVEKATKSDTAKKNNVKNNIDKEEHYENLMYLGCNIYDVLYEHFGSNLCINSCYRNEKVNKLVGGSSKSQHCNGQAIDLSVNGKYRNREIIQYIFDNKLDYDQIIWEYGDNVNPAWVHVSLKKENNRKKLTQAVKSAGKTHYKDLDINVVKLKK